MRPQFDNARLLKAAVFIFFLTLYVVTLVKPGDVAYLADSTYMFSVCQSLVEDGDVNILNQGAKLAKDRKDDQLGADVYMTSQYPIAPSLAGVPFYLMGKWVSRVLNRPPDDNDLFFATCLSGPVILALTCLLLFQFSLTLGFGPRVAFLIACCYGLGTTAWYHARVLATEPIIALAILGTVYAAYLYKIKGRYVWLYLSGFFAGVTVISREVSALIVPLVLGYLIAVVWGKAKDAPLKAKLLGGVRHLSIFLLGFIPFTILSAWYLLARYGVLSNLDYIPPGMTSLGFLFSNFNDPFFIGFYGYLFSPGQSVFLYNFILVLLFFSIKPFYAKYKAEFILFISIFLIHLLIYAKYVCWYGGTSPFGPRYLVPTLPLLVLPLGSFFETLPKRPFLTKVLVLLVFCIAVTVATADLWGESSSTFLAEVAMAEKLDQEDGWVLIQYFPRAFPLFWTHKPGAAVLNHFYFVPHDNRSLRLPILLLLLATAMGTGFYLVKKLHLVPGGKDLWSFTVRVAAFIRARTRTLFAYKRIALRGAALLVILASVAYASFKCVLLPLQRYNSKPFGSIENPLKGYVAGTTEIMGWVLYRLGIRAVEIYVDDVKVADARYGEPSLDIADVYPYIPNSHRARFTAKIDTSAFSNGIHVLLVKALDQKGLWTNVAGQLVTFLNEKPYDFWAHLSEAKASGGDVVEDAVLSLRQGSRRVLLQRANSEVTFEKVPVYDGAFLKLGVGIAHQGKPENGNGLVLGVVVDSSVPLLSMSINPEACAEDQTWHDKLIDLSPFYNQLISLTLITKTPFEGDYTSSQIGWSNLSVVYPNQRGPE